MNSRVVPQARRIQALGGQPETTADLPFVEQVVADTGDRTAA